MEENRLIVKSRSMVFERKLRLQSGAELGPITLAYETLGALNAEKSNAILVCHALSGDAHVAGWHRAEDRKPGWWDNAVGPGKVFDTNRYFIVCCNVIGGCGGSTGPSSVSPATGKPYGMSFPVVTLADMVEAQAWLMEELGLSQWLAVAGGSMGGMQALQWSVAHPDRVRSAIVIAATARVSAQCIALNEAPRQAIYADPKWRKGQYYEDKDPPVGGLAVARMIGHITYMSEQSMREKFGRRLQKRGRYGYDLETEFRVESYLQHQGLSFTSRFDANSFILLTKAIDYFDLADEHGGHLAHAFRKARAKFLVLSYSSDWLYPSAQSEELVRALNKNGLDATYMDIKSDYGHDAFLVDEEIPHLAKVIPGFLAGVERARHPGR